MIAVVLVFVVGRAAASEIERRQYEMCGADQLESGLQPQAKELMGEYKMDVQSNFFQSGMTMLRKAVSQSGEAFKSAVSTITRVLLIMVICQIADCMCREKGRGLPNIVGALAIMVCCASDLRTMIGLGRSTIQEITDYTSLLLPVMVSAATASGSLTAAGVPYAVATVFSNLLMRFCNGIVVPGIYAYLSLSLTDTVLQNERLNKLRELIGWVIEKGLKGIIYVFTGFLSITGMVAATVDKATLKAAKATISSVVPVVGGIISGAADSVFASATVLKSAVGTFGMLAVLAIFLLPFFKMGISYFLFKLSSALGAVFESKLSGLLEAITSVLGYFLALIAVGALISILTCSCLIRSVGV